MNDLSNELKALLEKADIRDMIVEPLEDGEWCSITTPSIDVCGDNVVIYARRMDGMIELSDLGVTYFNIDDEYKYIIEVECKIWPLLYDLGKRTDIHTVVSSRPKDFYYAFTRMDWALSNINNIAAYLLEEEDSNEKDE